MAIKAANTANRIPDAIAIPQSGSPKIANADVGLSSSAAAFSPTAGRTAATGLAAGFFLDAVEWRVTARRELMIDILLAHWVAHLNKVCEATRDLMHHATLLVI